MSVKTACDGCGRNREGVGDNFTECSLVTVDLFSGQSNGMTPESGLCRLKFDTVTTVSHYCHECWNKMLEALDKK